MRGQIGEGYHIFKAVVDDDAGFAKALTSLENQIKEAESMYDITFISGASVKDTPVAICVAFQTAVLTLKKGKK